MKNEEVKAIEGYLVGVTTGSTTYNYKGRVVTTKPKNAVTIRLADNEEIPADIIEATEQIDPQYQPAWFKDRNGFVTISNKFNVDVHIEEGVDPIGDGHMYMKRTFIGELCEYPTSELCAMLGGAGKVRVYYTVKDKYVNLYGLLILSGKTASHELPF